MKRENKDIDIALDNMYGSEFAEMVALIGDTNLHFQIFRLTYSITKLKISAKFG
jgi:hypothetical protein